MRLRWMLKHKLKVVCFSLLVGLLFYATVSMTIAEKEAAKGIEVLTCPPPPPAPSPKPFDCPLNSTYFRDTDTNPYCPWKFLRYEMSPYEKLWQDNAAAWGESPCTRFSLDNNEQYANYWSTYAKSAMDSRPTSPPDEKIFSSLVYSRTCTNDEMKIYIEPLALIMRHPLSCAPGQLNNYYINKDYMLVDWEVAQQRADTHGKVYLFDVGASTFNAGIGGASQSWFVDQIEKRGLKLDGIYSWEYVVYDAKDVFAVIPDHLVHIYHWYNIPVVAEVGNIKNPWEVMRKVATPDDLVIVKLDIDTPALETALVDQIISTPEIAQLIDVFFYEDHIGVKEMRPHFITSIHSLQDGIDSFVKLRNLGIRAHPWV